MSITIEQARVRLAGSRWVPVELIGEGGGGAVFLCASASLGNDLNAHASLLISAATRRVGLGTFGPQPEDPESVTPRLLSRLMIAAHTHSGIAAVKIPHPATAEASEIVRFQREIEAMKQHEHPALIRLFDSDTKTPPTWFAVEYHSKGDLQQIVNRERYFRKPLAVLKDIRPIAEGLGVLHRNGFVHRDVKPKNVFVADDGRLVLGDFGVVLLGEDATRITGTAIQSRDWVPDWVRFGELPTYTRAVDVFMLAKVIYFLMSGENVMASQVDRAFPALLAKWPDVPGLDSTLTMLRKCIVLHEDECSISDGSALAADIDQVLVAKSVAPQARLVFSFLSMSDPTSQPLAPRYLGPDTSPLPPVHGLSGLQVLLTPSTREFEARARHYGQNGVLEYRLGNAASQRVELPATGVSHPGSWSGPIRLHAGTPVSAGWCELTVGGVGTSLSLSGFMLYAL